MGMVYAYVTAWLAGLFHPLQERTVANVASLSELASHFGSKHGRWIGRWMHGKPTKAMIFKIFVLLSSMLMTLGFLNIDHYYRPITGLMIGSFGLLVFLFWGISDDDLKDS